MSYVENKYDVSIVIDSLKNFINLRQQTEEYLVDYTRRFKSARDGKLKLQKLAENHEDWDENDEKVKKECYDKVYQAFIANLYLENADRTKYGTLTTGLATQYSLGNDQYPKDLVSATNVLSNHRFDPTCQEKLKKIRNKGNNNQNRNHGGGGNQKINGRSIRRLR